MLPPLSWPVKICYICLTWVLLPLFCFREHSYCSSSFIWMPQSTNYICTLHGSIFCAILSLLLLFLCDIALKFYVTSCFVSLHWSIVWYWNCFRLQKKWLQLEVFYLQVPHLQQQMNNQKMKAGCWRWKFITYSCSNSWQLKHSVWKINWMESLQTAVWRTSSWSNSR